MPAREVAVQATTTLEHRAYLVRAWPGGVVAADTAGDVTVLGPDLAVRERYRLDAPLSDLAFADDGTRAWISGDVLHPAGVPVPEGTACRWLPGTDELWVVGSTGDEVRIDVRADGRVRATTTVPDPFGGSVLMLGEHPDPACVIAWVAAGQDGQQSWLLTRTGTGIDAAPLPCDDSLPAVFGPAGDWFVTADDALVRRGWPGGDLVGSLDFDALGAQDDAPGHDLRVLPGGTHAAWSTGSGRLWVIDLARLVPVEEIVLAGHPVRTTVELYPTLTGDHTPCGDLDFAVPGPDGLIVSVHQRRTLVLSRARDWLPADGAPGTPSADR